jgi:hypothetical protein
MRQGWLDGIETALAADETGTEADIASFSQNLAAGRAARGG